MSDPKRALIRHVAATIAYRGAKALRGAPESFANFRASHSTRTALEILAHLGDLIDWALTLVKGERAWHDSTPLPWAQECDRFFRALQAFDAYLASDASIDTSYEKLFQGGLADALTHIGQIAMLRRMAGSPVRGENYYVAEIEAGRVGPEQAAALREFD